MATDNKPGRKSRKKGPTSEEIVERHLHDPKDVITTEDIQNVKVPPLDEAEVSGILSSEEEDLNPLPGEKKDHITPWNLVDPET